MSVLPTSQSTAASNEATILSINNLTISYHIGNQWRDVVRDVTLAIGPKQVYGLVGESGSGKTTLAMAVMRYLADNGRISNGSILLDGVDLTTKSSRQMRHIWGSKMSLVPQDPGASLNPSIKIGPQLAEIPQRHFGLSQQQAIKRSAELLEQVRIPDVQRIMQLYPHQLSGGMQQRVTIAMALSTEPRLLVLDEPTTSLDVTTEATVLDLIKDLISKQNAATLYVTHNLAVIAQISQRVAVMYAGEIMEDASVTDLFARPLHPYTITLLRAVPRLGEDVQGSIPATSNAPDPNICVFAGRCPFAIEKCWREKPPVEATGPDSTVKCHRWREIATNAIRMPEPAANVPLFLPTAPDTNQPLLMLAGVNVDYPVGAPLLARLRGRKPQMVHAVDDVTLDVLPGQTVGLVGESGSGKTSLARAVVGLVEINSGKMQLIGAELPSELHRRPLDTLRRMQMVFQNPDESLNPYITVGESLRRPLITLLKYDNERANKRVRELLKAVHLPEEYASRLPGELSGGEKQRVAIARAFSTDPNIVVLDEAVSALDVSVEASILDLLKALKEGQHTSYLFISHDLAVVGNLADVIMVMYLGQLVEKVPADKLLSTPIHPYTEALLSAIPIPDPTAQREHIRLYSDTPSPVKLPTGCRFHTRCPRIWGPICEREEPGWQDAGDGHLIRCHYPLDELAALQNATRSGLIPQPGQPLKPLTNSESSGT